MGRKAGLRLLICGSRNWTDEDFIYDLMSDFSDEVTIIHGAASGADTCADNAARHIGLKVERYPANWRKFGNKAGPIRNRQMLRDGRPDEVWAFHDDLDKSRGTANMVKLAIKAGLKVTVYRHDGAPISLARPR